MSSDPTARRGIGPAGDRGRAPRRAIAAAVLAGLTASVVAVGVTSVSAATHSLSVSTSPDRSGAVALEGAVVSGNVFVFVGPDAGAVRVRFWLDNPTMSGTPTKIEGNAPWDFVGTNADGTAIAYDTTKLVDGPHSISVRVDLDPSGTETFSASFTVANGGSEPPPPPPTAHDIFVSSSSSRSSPARLDGATLAGNAYIFVAPDAGASRVRFWLDRPAKSGTPTRVDRSAPWDLVGANSNGTAKPFDTTQLTEGTHFISVVVDLTPSGTSTFTATFTVDNTTSPPPPPPPAAWDQVHLSWVSSPSTTLTVVWRTWQTSTPSEVRYRAVGTQTWSVATGATKTSGTTGTLHQVTMSSLMPSTSYQYEVRGDGGVWSSTYVAETAPAPGPADFDFTYVADTGIIGRTDGLATGTEQVLQEIERIDPTFVLGGGDYAYFDKDKRFGTLDNTIDAWFNQMQAVASASPLMPAYGNHEIGLQESYAAWSPRFALPSGFSGGSKQYSFDVGDVHFVNVYAVSSANAMSSSQLDWLRQDLQRARADSGIRWIVPFFHVSPFADGSSHPSNLALRAQLGPLFEQYDVDLAIASHDQSFERTYPLVDVPSTNTPTSSSLTCYTRDDGVIWLKVSPGGKLSNKNGGFSTFQTFPPPAWTAVRDDTMHHFLHVDVSAAGSLTVTVHGVVGDGSTPTVVDRFVVTDGSC